MSPWKQIAAPASGPAQDDMKYFATVNDQTYEIDIDHHGRVTVDGMELAADMQAGGRNQPLLAAAE